MHMRERILLCRDYDREAIVLKTTNGAMPGFQPVG
jgi:hypothetical protein